MKSLELSRKDTCNRIKRRLRMKGNWLTDVYLEMVGKMVSL